MSKFSEMKAVAQAAIEAARVPTEDEEGGERKFNSPITLTPEAKAALKKGVATVKETTADARNKVADVIATEKGE